jgi:hypothetical protein
MGVVRFSPFNNVLIRDISVGLFLAMSSVVGAKPKEVEASVGSYVTSRGGSFERASGTLREDQEARLLESQGGTTLVYPDGFTEWDEVSAKLSADLERPSFSFHIHDGDLWMFILFVDGNEAVRFNPIPDYWKKLGAEERSTWLPSANEIARHVPGAHADEIAPYLVEWPVDGLAGKAHADDEFAFIDWQVTDFMRRIGFHYPGPGQGFAYRFSVKPQR